MSEITVIQAKDSVSTAQTRVAAYCRVSSDSADQLNSFIAQVKYYTDYIGKHSDWMLADIYADEGLSGTKIEKRTEFNRMMQDCRKGRIDLIIVKSVSRFARNTVDCLTAIRELKQLGIVVRFEKEDLDTSKIGSEMTISCNGTLAQEESMSISKNVRWGTRKRMENGTFIAGCAPFGYTLVKGELVINDDEADIVRRIFQLYLDGNGKLAIAKILNRDETAKKYRNWTTSAIEYIIRNEKYIGDALLQKGYTTDTLPFKFKRNYGQLPQYYVENTHEGIVSGEIFQRVQQIIKNREPSSRRANGEYPLSRKIKCRCGTIYRRVVINVTVYWACRAKEHGEDGEHSMRIPEDALYRTFVHTVNKLRLHYQDILTPLITQMETIKSDKNGQDAKIFTIDKQIAELNRQNLVLAELKAKGYMDSADYLSQSDATNKEVNKLRSQRAKLLKDNEDNTLLELYGLRDNIQGLNETITEFEPTLFSEMVERIYPAESGYVTFQLSGGLKIREKVVR